MMRRELIVLFCCLLLWPVQGWATSVTFRFHDELADKDFSIEWGLEVLTHGRLGEGWQEVELDPLRPADVPRVPARVSINGHKEFGFAINLFQCSKRCKFQVVLPQLPLAKSDHVDAICKRPPDTAEGMFERYFFCRKAYLGHLAAEGACWPEARQALSGWFDAAYQLHIQTLRDGAAFLARDKIAEAYVRDAQAACPDFEGSVRNPGYFGGMFRELDKAELQATQRVERLIDEGEMEAARSWAESIIQEIGTQTDLRKHLKATEIRYVEAILNRALPAGSTFRLP